MSCTLDPPGTVLVLGTTSLGIEAALYGRYLGYEVHLIAAADEWRNRPWVDANSLWRIGPTFHNDVWSELLAGGADLGAVWDQPLPMLPDRSLSPLAIAALAAQAGQRQWTEYPLTIGQWIDQSLLRLSQTDLLRGRVDGNAMVTRIEQVEIDPDDAPEVDEGFDEEESIPPDFLVHHSNGMTTRAESVIVADISLVDIEMSFSSPTDYFFTIHSKPQETFEQVLRDGWRQIAAIYAELAGRADLDLYRPVRM